MLGKLGTSFDIGLGFGIWYTVGDRRKLGLVGLGIYDILAELGCRCVLATGDGKAGDSGSGIILGSMPWSGGFASRGLMPLAGFRFGSCGVVDSSKAASTAD